MPGGEQKFGLADLRAAIEGKEKSIDGSLPSTDTEKTPPSEEQVTLEEPQSADDSTEKNTSSESVHPEFRRRLETDLNTEADKFFEEEVAFVDGEGKFIPAAKAVEMFREILKKDEHYPINASLYIEREHVRPISERINKLTREIKEAEDEAGARTSESRVLRKERNLASNSLLITMHSVLIEPKAFLIDPEDFEKNKDELTLTADDLLDKSQIEHPSPLHVSGREVSPGTVRGALNQLIERLVEQAVDLGGYSKGEAVGILKQAFVGPLIEEYKTASFFDRGLGRNEAIRKRVQDIRRVENSVSTFVKVVTSYPDIVEKLLRLHETRTEFEGLEDLMHVFPKEFFRAPTNLKGDEHRKERRNFYKELVENYDDERLDALADAYKYPDDSEYTDMVFQDEAGYKPIHLRWAEASHLMRRAGLSEDHINHSYVTAFKPRFTRLYELTKQLSDERKKGGKRNRSKVKEIQDQMMDVLVDMRGDMNKRIVNPTVYMLRNPLTAEDKQVGEVTDDLDLDVELTENEMQFAVSDVYDREERLAAYAVLKSALMQYFNDQAAGMGDNQFKLIYGDKDGLHDETSGKEYKAVETAMIALNKLVTRGINSADEDPNGEFAKAVSEASQEVDDSLATFSEWFAATFAD